FRFQHLRLGGAQLGFRFRRRDGGNHLSSRDLVAFVHRQRRQPARIFGRDIDLRRLDAAVRLHDSVGHRAAAQTIDEGFHLGSQLLGGGFLRGFGVRGRNKQAPSWRSSPPSNQEQRAGNESRRQNNGGRLANGHRRSPLRGTRRKFERSA